MVDKGYGSLSVFTSLCADSARHLSSTVVQGIFVLCVSLHHILLMYELPIYTVN
jgi:hypothetical protein